MIGEAEGWTIYDALADPRRARAAAPDALGRERAVERGHAALPLGPAPAAGMTGRSRCGRSASSSRTRRSCSASADPEGVPARRAGREPRARAAALPVRARVPEHRPAGRLVRVRGPAAWTRRSGSCRSTWRARATAGSWRSRSSGSDPEAFLDAPARARRGDRRAAHGARLGHRHPGVRARGAEHGGAGPADRRRRRADRADVRRPAGDGGARADRRPRRRTCANSCRRSRTSAPAGA